MASNGEIDKFLKEFERICKENMKNQPLFRSLEENDREKIGYTISLYLRSQLLKDFFGLEDQEGFRETLNRTLQSRKTKKIFFLDILGAHAWANPLFHSYMYEQILAYMRRNRTNIWNLEIQDDLLREKIENRLGKEIDVDDVMPDYDSGDPIDLQIVRILAWDERDMKSDVAKDLIDLHKVANIPLFYIPYRNIEMALQENEKVEFHLALDKNEETVSTVDKNGKTTPDGCWIYSQREGKRRLYREGDTYRTPKAIIEKILKDNDCVFAEEKRRQLLNETSKGIRILAINSPTKDTGGFRGSPTSLLYALSPLIEAIKAKKINVVGFSQLNIFDPTYATDLAQLETDLRERLDRIQPHIVAISTTSLTLYFAEFIARIVKEVPDRIVVVGGPHCDEVCFNPGKVNPNNPINPPTRPFDFVISGDGEYMLLTLVHLIVDGMQWLKLKENEGGLVEDIKGYVLSRQRAHEEFADQPGIAEIHFRHKGEEHTFRSSWKKIDLDKLKPLRYEYLKKDHLRDFGIFNDPKDPNGKPQKCVQVMTHRGCLGNCNFCTERIPLYGYESHRYYNQKNVDAIINELQHYVEKLGIQAVFFDDSTFLDTPGFIEELCDRMVESGLSRLRWGCLNRFDKVKDERLIERMTRAGLEYMYLGLELKDNKALEVMNKARNIQHNPSNSNAAAIIEKALDMLQEKKIRVGLSILFGHPRVSEEAKDAEKKTIEWVGKMVTDKKIELVSLSLFNHHEASNLSQGQAEVVELNYFDVQKNIEKQNKSPWNCFEEGGWFHDYKTVNEDYLSKLLWMVNQHISKSSLVREKQLEEFMKSDWVRAKQEEEEAFSIINEELQNVSLSDFAVVGDCLMYDGEHRDSMKEKCYKRIFEELKRAKSKHKSSYWLIWGHSRGGKTFLVEEIGKEALINDYYYERVDLSSNDLNKESLAETFKRFEQESRSRPALCFIDEIASKPQGIWQFTNIKSFIDKIEDSSLPITLVLAGSIGNDIGDLKEYLVSQPTSQGTDMLLRINSVLSEYSVPDTSVGDRIIIALSCIDQAAMKMRKTIRLVEKSALYWMALSPMLRYPGQIRIFVGKAIERISGNRVTYESCFGPGEHERVGFESRVDESHLRDLHKQYIHVSSPHRRGWSFRATKEIAQHRWIQDQSGRI